MILHMYVTLMPVILAGIGNMIFTKTSLYKRHKHPIDGGRVLNDGRRLFGDNKTWIGFVSMIVIGAFVQLLWGTLGKATSLGQCNDWYENLTNTPCVNLLIGALLGFAYMFCELPNSFIKRRLNITPGKRGTGFIGVIFYLVDQLDSILGVVFVLSIFVPITALQFIGYLILGAGTHIIVNLLLYAARIRKNP